MNAFGRYNSYGSSADAAAAVGYAADAAEGAISTGFETKAAAKIAETQAVAAALIAKAQAEAGVTTAGTQETTARFLAEKRTQLALGVVGGLAVIGTLGLVAYVATQP